MKTPARPVEPQKILFYGFLSVLGTVVMTCGVAFFIFSLFISLQESAESIVDYISKQQIGLQKIYIKVSDPNLHSNAEDKDKLFKRISKLKNQTDHILDTLFKKDRLIWSLSKSTLISEQDIKSYSEVSDDILEYKALAFRIANSDKTDARELNTLVNLREKIDFKLDKLAVASTYLTKQKARIYQKILIILYCFIIFVFIASGALVFLPIAKVLKKDRHQIEVSKDEAEAANNHKTEFIANVSHEIRTPLAAIAGYSEMLLVNPQTSASSIATLNSIKKSSEHLKKLIDDLLDISRIEANKVKIIQKEVDVLGFLNEIQSLMQIRVQEKHLDLVIKFTNSIPAYIESDLLRLKQILINLVNNAVKFTDTGSITVEVSYLKGESHRCSKIRVTVKDTGHGIPREKQAVIFEKFSQIDSSLTKDSSGVGLGLTISRRLTRLMGGELMLVSSELGKGSIFVAEFPAKHAPDVQFIRQYTGAYRDNQSLDIKGLENVLLGHNILLVEDGEDNQKILKYFLELAGAQVELAVNGEVGFQKGAALDPDLILMDIQMPVLDGYGATKKLRKQGYSKPIVALSAHVDSDKQSAYRKLGFDGYLSKPIAMDNLIKAILHHLDSTHQQKLPKVVSTYENNDALTDLIKEFCGNLPSRVDEIRCSMDDLDYGKLKSSLHKIKGAASSYGFPQITLAASQLEDLVKDVPTESRSPLSQNFMKKFRVFEELCMSARRDA